MKATICVLLAELLIVALVLGAYYIGKHDGASEAILTARPFIVEYVEYPADDFTVYIDYQEYGVHEYTGFVG